MDEEKLESGIVYFHKELLSNPIHLANGGSPRWESCGDDDGIIATKTDWLIAELRKFAGRRVGGINEITKAVYDAKKNSGDQGLPRRPRLIDPPLFQMYRTDSREVPLVAADTAVVHKSTATPSNPDYVEAVLPGNAAPSDPAANRPIARKVPKTPKSDQPSILP